MFPTTKPNRRFQTRALLLALGLATLPGIRPGSAETTVTGDGRGQASLSTDAGADGTSEQAVADAVSQAKVEIHTDLSIRSANDGAVSGIVTSGGGATGDGDGSGAAGASAGVSASGGCPTSTGGVTANQGSAATTIGLVLAWVGSCDAAGPGAGQPGDPGTPPGAGLPALGDPGSGGPGSGDPNSGLPIDVLGFQVPGGDLLGGGNPRHGDQQDGEPENGHHGSGEPGDGQEGGLPSGLLASGLLPGGLLPSGLLPTSVLPITHQHTPAAGSDPNVATSGATGIAGRALPVTAANGAPETPAAGGTSGLASVGPAQWAVRPLIPLGGAMPRTGSDLHVRALVGLGLLGLAGLRRRPRSA